MQKLFTFLCLIFIGSGIHAQNSIPAYTCVILYKYDAAGNRISQEYYCNNTGNPEIVLRSAPVENSKPVTIDATPDSKPVSTDKTSVTFLKVDALYPNPTTGRFTITFSAPLKNATIFITDAGGKAVQQKGGYTGSRVELDLSNVSPGIYFIRIPLAGGKFITHKVVKQ